MIFQLTFLTVVIIIAAVACGQEEGGVVPPPSAPSFYNKPDKVVPPIVPAEPDKQHSTIRCC
mgnify:CR=1 FL=1|jgi:hypothetical protein